MGANTLLLNALPKPEEAKVGAHRVKLVAAAVAGSAIVAAVAIVTASGPEPEPQTVASGSGDSATGPLYAQPTVPAMTLPSTTTEIVPTVLNAAATAIATSDASPTFKATPPSGFAP